MAHHLYQTKGIIIARRPLGEGNQLFIILTRELGLVLAAAQGVRLLKSKLRYHLQLGRLCNLTLVRGKELWRIVGVETEIDFQTLFETTEGRRCVKTIFGLIRRLIQGEEPHPELFDDAESILLAGLRFSTQLPVVTTIGQLRLLNHLGYLPGDTGFDTFVKGAVWQEETLLQFTPKLAQANEVIQSVLATTHLT